jgi:NADH-quinone oxidoreductase subunit F
VEAILLTDGVGKGPQSIAAYQAEGGYEAVQRAVAAGPQSVLEAVVASGLRGRGGAGFPAGQKWSFAASEAEPEKYVVSNGGEDEPGSLKDRVLMEGYPHKILEGVILASFAIGAHEAVLYVNSLYEQAIAGFERAIREATEAGFLGPQVAGVDYALTVRIHPATQEYVAGEDSASLESIEGKKAMPRQKPPFPTTAGLHGKPTVVNNMETFAYVPAIVRNGPEWFRGQGTGDNPGTMLFTLPGNLRNPGVVELPVGTPLRALIEEHGGGVASGRAIKAVLPGGPSSGFVTAENLDVAMDRGPLTEIGSTLGCGVLRVIEEGECMVEVVDEIAKFFQEESCGQCPTCVMTTNALANITEHVKTGQGQAAMLEQVPKLGMFAKGKGFCALITMPVPPLTSAIRLFPDDFAAHLEGRCPAKK